MPPSRIEELDELMRQIASLRYDESNFHKLYDMLRIEYEHEKLFTSGENIFKNHLSRTIKTQAQAYIDKKKKSPNEDNSIEFLEFTKAFLNDVSDGVAHLRTKKE